MSKKEDKNIVNNTLLKSEVNMVGQDWRKKTNRRNGDESINM